MPSFKVPISAIRYNRPARILKVPSYPPGAPSATSEGLGKLIAQWFAAHGHLVTFYLEEFGELGVHRHFLYLVITRLRYRCT